MKTNYRWSHPLEWLLEKVDQWDVEKLRSEFITIARELDGDQIQDLYQDDMDEDGYFKQLKS